MSGTVGRTFLSANLLPPGIPGHHFLITSDRHECRSLGHAGQTRMSAPLFYAANLRRSSGRVLIPRRTALSTA
jgi:hypothetical protein